MFISGKKFSGVYNYRGDKIMKTGYKVCDAMTRQPVVVSPKASLQECAKIMGDEHVGAVIVKEGDVLAGIITEQDIVRKSVILDDKPSSRTAKDIMETGMHTIEPEKDIYDALVHMKEHNIRHLPVTDGKGMLGLLTLKDVLKIEPQLFDLLVEKFEVREEEKKPVNNQTKEEGLCQQCGKYASKLFEQEGTMVCRSCWE
jgi:signal-transduction protein with cAMP-binding, CBS, and nucleotidyltransferase domain